MTRDDMTTRILKAMLLILCIVAPIMSGLAYVSDKSDRIYATKDSFSMVLSRMDRLEAKIDRLIETISKRK